MKLTLGQFVNLVYSEKVIYFYEDEPTDFDNEGRYDFSSIELFLAYQSCYKPRCVLLPEVCERTIAQIYFYDDIIRVVLDDKEVSNEQN